MQLLRSDSEQEFLLKEEAESRPHRRVWKHASEMSMTKNSAVILKTIPNG